MGKIKFINLTIHDINIMNKNGEIITVPPSGMHARLGTNETYSETVDGIDIYDQEILDIQGLPEPQEGVYYLASMPLRLAAKEVGRHDVLSPDTGGTAVRDETNQVKYVIRLVR